MAANLSSPWMPRCFTVCALVQVSGRPEAGQISLSLEQVVQSLHTTDR